MLAVKSYFDGSEIPAKAMTLAAVAADEQTWSQLESLWNEVRVERGNPTHIHMTDLMALEGIYKDWKGDDRDHLVGGLINVLLSFRGNPNLYQFTTSINLKDYIAVRAEKNLPTPERMCSRLVFPQFMDWYAEIKRLDIGKVELYFDRGEKFMRHIYEDWISKKIRRRHPMWELVGSIGTAVMEQTTALQIADVVAWGRNRLTSGSHWTTDPHYATAVQVCGSLYSTHRPIDKEGLRNFRYKEEGFAAIDPQRKQREEAMAHEYRSEEFKRFDKMMRELMHVRHDELKKLLDKEKEEKKRKKSKKSSASREAV